MSGVLHAVAAGSRTSGVTSIVDNFDRANSDSLGSDWVEKVANANSGIVSNAATYKAGGNPVAMHVTELAYDDIQVSVTLGGDPTLDYVFLVIGGATKQASALVGGAGLNVNHMPSYSVASRTDIEGYEITLAANDVVVFKRVGTSYTLAVNSTVYITWNDTSVVVPVGAGNRYAGIGFSNSGISALAWSAQTV